MSFRGEKGVKQGIFMVSWSIFLAFAISSDLRAGAPPRGALRVDDRWKLYKTSSALSVLPLWNSMSGCRGRRTHGVPARCDLFGEAQDGIRVEIEVHQGVEQRVRPTPRRRG